MSDRKILARPPAKSVVLRSFVLAAYILACLLLVDSCLSPSLPIGLQ